MWITLLLLFIFTHFITNMITNNNNVMYQNEDSYKLLKDNTYIFYMLCHL